MVTRVSHRGPIAKTSMNSLPLPLETTTGALVAATLENS